jgi:hypothetical protein
MAPVTPPTPAESPKVPPLRERLFRPGLLIKTAVLASLLVVGPWAVQQLPELDDRPEYQLPFRDVRLIPPPTPPLPADFLDQVRHRAGLPEGLPLLDPELPERLAAAFAEHPWVERVNEVRNQSPAMVTVTLQYRRPVALVAVPEGVYAVDSQGILLPPQDFSAEDAQDYLVIRGITSVPHGAAGKPWGDPAVAAAAALADFLGDRWKELQLTAIIAPRLTSAQVKPQDLLLELETQGGSRIQWGRMPGSTYPGELEATQKVGRLDKYLQEFGSYHAPQGPYAIDIRHWQEITRKPLVDARFHVTLPTNRR